MKLTLPSELKKISSTFVVEGARTNENEESEETVKDVKERVACKALTNRDDTEGNIHAGVCVFKDVKQETFKNDTMDATFEDGNASTYAGGDFDGACFSLVPGIVWQCFLEHLQNELCSATPKSDGLFPEQSDESNVRLGAKRAEEDPPDDSGRQRSGNAKRCRVNQTHRHTDLMGPETGAGRKGQSKSRKYLAARTQQIWDQSIWMQLRS